MRLSTYYPKTITDRLRAEAERKNLLVSDMMARHSAEGANRLKDEFLATLFHELRTSVNAMVGWTQLLQTQNLMTLPPIALWERSIAIPVP